VLLRERVSDDCVHSLSLPSFVYYFHGEILVVEFILYRLSGRRFLGRNAYCIIRMVISKRGPHDM